MALGRTQLRRSSEQVCDAAASKGAPVPVPGHTGGDLGLLIQRGRESVLVVPFLGFSIGNALDSGRISGLSIQQGLNAVQAFRPRLLPALVCTVAQLAGTRWNSIRVEASILVEWNHMGSMRGAEDMATVTAMMTAQKETERRSTGRRITVGRCRVRLQGSNVSYEIEKLC